MTRLSLAKDLKSALKGADFVLVVAPKKTLDKKRLPKLLPPKAQKTLGDLGKLVSPGDLGASMSSLTFGTPGWVAAGALPDTLSRYNAPSRAEAITKVVSGASFGDAKKPAIIVILDDEAHHVAAANAVGRALPIFNARSKGRRAVRAQLAMVDTSGDFITPSPIAREVLRCSRESAELVDSPPTDMNPRELAERAIGFLEGANVSIETIVGDALLERRLGGIHGVGRAAVEAPRLLIATYEPENSTSKKHIALVGKGVTFDTGGLHIKPRGSMETMKCDMGGAAAVLGAFRVLVKTGCPHKVSLLMCLAENSVDSRSFKPDDILTLHSKRTVEINNTDAEGRLLLGDGVSYAARELKATHVINAATLTGAQMIATGAAHAAVVSNDGDLEKHFVESGFATGDLVHPLIFAPELYKQEFSSKVADMKNSVKNRANAQSSCAAQFVYNHIEDTKVGWVHIDLAGPSFRGERGTGFGVALISDAVRRL
ncbi:MAG: leucyl aminopeptidase family protein [Deltaproteobacteria bacterium]